MTPGLSDGSPSSVHEALANLLESRVIVQCKRTFRNITSKHIFLLQVIDETLSPTWDELLVFEEILVYGRREDIRTNPPTVIIEIYDQDKAIHYFICQCHYLLLSHLSLSLVSIHYSFFRHYAWAVFFEVQSTSVCWALHWLLGQAAYSIPCWTWISSVNRGIT